MMNPATATTIETATGTTTGLNPPGIPPPPPPPPQEFDDNILTTVLKFSNVLDLHKWKSVSKGFNRLCTDAIKNKCPDNKRKKFRTRRELRNITELKDVIKHGSDFQIVFCAHKRRYSDDVGSDLPSSNFQVPVSDDNFHQAFKQATLREYAPYTDDVGRDIPSSSKDDNFKQAARRLRRGDAEYIATTYGWNMDEWNVPREFPPENLLAADAENALSKELQTIGQIIYRTFGGKLDAAQEYEDHSHEWLDDCLKLKWVKIIVAVREFSKRKGDIEFEVNKAVEDFSALQTKDGISTEEANTLFSNVYHSIYRFLGCSFMAYVEELEDKDDHEAIRAYMTVNVEEIGRYCNMAATAHNAMKKIANK